MQKELVIGITIAAYIIFTILIGLLNSRNSKNISDFTVGGRNAGAWVSALSYGTAYFSAVMFVGYAGATGWKYGIWGVLVGIGNAVFGSLLAWLVLARRTRETTRRLNIKSMPQFFYKRFESTGMKRFSVAIIFIFLLPYSASVYKGLTSVCSVLLGMDERICMIIIALAAAAVVILGGYVAILKADFVQGIIMFVGIIAMIIAVVRSKQVGGLAAGLDAIAKETKKLNLGIKEHIGLWATVLMTSFGTWGLPQMIHKYYGIRDDHEVKRGTIISTVFALVIAGGGYFVGTFSHLFFTQRPNNSNDYLIPYMLDSAGLSNILLGLVLVLLISASVSTLASITISASSTLTMDFIGDRLFPKMTSATATRVTKVICGVFVVLSYIIANSQTPILDMMSYSWGVLSGSFLAPYMLSLYWKGLNRAGGWAGMLGGFIIASPPVFCKLLFSKAELPRVGLIADLGPHFACAAMIMSLVLCVAVSKLAAKAGWPGSAENPAFYGKDNIKTSPEEMPILNNV
ncbi:MAG: sodium:solute symporter family protein [Oscillospiraceae bacterium]|nr:sodium:solute symporter family protein [Oscillospiraceae bacterium]MDD4414872.1 sodium:solute symporter family protein [Oscillospiraceae bacterium]